LIKTEILLRLRDLVERARGVSRSDSQLGWDLIDLEKELVKLEVDLADQIDIYMTNRYREYNAVKAKEKNEKDVTRVPRHYRGAARGTALRTSTSFGC
jgi:hypothetical protein